MAYLVNRVCCVGGEAHVWPCVVEITVLGRHLYSLIFLIFRVGNTTPSF